MPAAGWVMDWSGLTVGVTGGAGFIGSHLVDSLVVRGATVVVLDNFSSGKADQVPSSVRLVSGSVADSTARSEALSGCDAIFHIAAIASVVACEEDPEKSASVNREASLAILAEASCPVVFASSAAIYGNPQQLPVSESHPIEPLSHYGADKAAADAAIRSLGDSAPPAVAMRFFNVYGPRQDPSSPYSGVLSIFTTRAITGEPVTIFGDGLQTRDFIHVTDVVDALVQSAESLLVEGTMSPLHSRAFNVCTGRPVTLLDVVSAIESNTGKMMQVTHEPTRAGDIRDSEGDPSALKEVLAWNPQVELEQGLVDLLNAL